MEVIQTMVLIHFEMKDTHKQSKKRSLFGIKVAFFHNFGHFRFFFFNLRLLLLAIQDFMGKPVGSTGEGTKIGKSYLTSRTYKKN